MRRHFIGIGVVGSLLAAAPSAHAMPGWLGQPICTAGTLTVCASVNAFMNGENMLVIEVTNLYPTLGIDNTITAFGFRMLDGWTGTWDLISVNGSGDFAGWTSVPPSNTEIWNGPTGFDLEVAVDRNGVGGGIMAGQTVVFVIDVGGSNPIGDYTELRWHSQALGPNGLESIKCDTGIAEDEDGSSYPGCNIVPEPFTMALLATGLAGLGGVGALRRRRKGLDVENG